MDRCLIILTGCLFYSAVLLNICRQYEFNEFMFVMIGKTLILLLDVLNYLINRKKTQSLSFIIFIYVFHSIFHLQILIITLISVQKVNVFSISYSSILLINYLYRLKIQCVYYHSLLNIDILQKYKFSFVLDNIDETCCVCLENINANEIRTKSECRHNFHEQCIREWCTNNSTCPMCRFEFNKKL